ncbi:DUF4309 domain-containing protein [Alkalihalobacillus sp. LMS39]|uniref:DUF4309 domain-containing protein n=1 Tax=Alkalihalobacillus sp. LMS39 TaxID=2924032 RepID=UPI001FB3D6FD|nr:DUF4309 domain-containing protein [Alkalihalobacillus sp. LMS39]UOE93025.1 DUF4309 domain-containing protein [Alkalihalobacillus sp. LMS39]
MKKVNWLILLLILILLGGCGQENGLELVDKEKVQINEQEVKTINIASKTVSVEGKEETLDFTWIEKAYEGYLADIPLAIGTEKEQVLTQFGEPLEEGYYNGGQFLDYTHVTFFINPETNKTSAIAVPFEEHEKVVSDLYHALGTPDIVEYNEMEDFWAYEYHVGKHILQFETKEKEGTIHYAWIRLNFNEPIEDNV